MLVLLTGVSCVGKTSVGSALAELLGVPFVDLDDEVERRLGAPIERLQQRFGSLEVFRDHAAEVLTKILDAPSGRRGVIALPPSGLRGAYWRVVKRYPARTVVLKDTPENILDRIAFFDADSRPIEKTLTPRERLRYLGEIRKDIDYFARSYRRAELQVDISTCTMDEAAARVRDALLKATPPNRDAARHAPI